jgi:hypothetical protein
VRPRHNDFREDTLTSGPTVGELAVSQSHLLPKQRHDRGGQPGHSLARSPLAWLAIKTRLPVPLSAKHPTLRSPLSAPWGRANALATRASGTGHLQANRWSLSLKRGRVGLGSPAPALKKATAAGASLPRCSRKRLALGCKRIGVPLSHGPA